MLNPFQLITVTQVATGLNPNRNATVYFTIVNEVSAVKTFDNMTGTAKVILPRNLKYNNQNIYNDTNPLFLRGDKIKIECGYMPNLDTIFEGYISRINNGTPTEILCEDGMFLLKQKIITNKTYANVSLTTLLADTIGDTVPYNNITAQLGSVRINEASVGIILDKLREEYGLFSFFVGNTLRVGLPFYAAKKTATFLFEKHIIESDLEYLRTDDIKVKIKGTLVNGNTKIEKEFGDKDGDLRTFFLYDSTEAELKRICESKLNDYKYEGYNGSFTTFLQPAVSHGDYAVIASYKNPERNGTYLIKSVETSCGVNGGRQIIELERKVL